MRVTHAVVVVTGAASGIGRATALAFADQHAALVLASRREQAVADLARECEGRGAEALAVTTDVTDDKAVTELARRAAEHFGRIDVWVNNAAVGLFASLEEMPLPDLRRQLDVDLLGYVHGARAALPYLRAQGSGVLVNVSSVVGQVAQPYAAGYAMAKAGVRALSGSLRAELALSRARGIAVCTVLPAAVDTPFFRQAANYTGRAVSPVPPVYTPQRVARTILSTVRRPRREAYAGAAGWLLHVQHTLLPGLTERVFARHVDAYHFSQHRPAPDTAGTLYAPSDDTRDAEAAGGWGGHRRTVQRGLLAAGGAVAVAAAVRRLRRATRRGEASC